MSEFFDQKEEVLDIQMTQYGKYLLSKGQMRPVYYAFFDDDIIYDSQYMEVAESQNDTQYRIKNETPRRKAQYVFHGVETEVREANEIILNSNFDLSAPKAQPTAEKAMAFARPLGTCDPNTLKVPAWDVKFYMSELSSSKSTYSGSSHHLMNIPQLETYYKLETSVQKGEFVWNGEEEEEEGPQNQSISEERSGIVSDDYLDGSNYIGKEKYLFLDVQELNTVLKNDNYDIEVFKVETEFDTHANGNIEKLIPLSFFNQDDKAETFATEDILAANYPELDSTYVEYYFNIHVDDEIIDDIFCEVQENVYFEHKKEDIFIDSRIKIDCPDKKETTSDGLELYGQAPVGQEEEC